MKVLHLASGNRWTGAAAPAFAETEALRQAGVDAHYDNSTGNKFNPDPSKEIHWGPQNWDEMQSVFLGFIFPVQTDVAHVLDASGPSLLPRPKTGGGPTLARPGWPAA